MTSTKSTEPTPKGGRYSNVSLREARAAARAQVTIDRRRGRKTARWIEKLATGK